MYLYSICSIKTPKNGWEPYPYLEVIADFHIRELEDLRQKLAPWKFMENANSSYPNISETMYPRVVFLEAEIIINSVMHSFHGLLTFDEILNVLIQTLNFQSRCSIRLLMHFVVKASPTIDYLTRYKPINMSLFSI